MLLLSSLGIAWEGGLGPWVGVGAAKELADLNVLALRVDAGATWVEGLRPRVQPAVQMAMASQEYPL